MTKIPEGPGHHTFEQGHGFHHPRHTGNKYTHLLCNRSACGVHQLYTDAWLKCSAGNRKPAQFKTMGTTDETFPWDKSPPVISPTVDLAPLRDHFNEIKSSTMPFPPQKLFSLLPHPSYWQIYEATTLFGDNKAGELLSVDCLWHWKLNLNWQLERARERKKFSALTDKFSTTHLVLN